MTSRKHTQLINLFLNWPSVCSLLRNVCFGPLLTFKMDCLLFWIVWVLYQFWMLTPQMSPKFWYVIVFLIFTMFILISSFISSLSQLLFSSILFNLHILVVFSASFLQLIFNFKALCLENMLAMILTFLNLMRQILCLKSVT